ncbi:MAG: hypothetical protein NTX72_04335 [Candidatus Uhrbacteria bacterium]|nr:hypothetical protein [Candidatus Uhrbacteria bacterium]
MHSSYICWGDRSDLWRDGEDDGVIAGATGAEAGVGVTTGADAAAAGVEAAGNEVGSDGVKDAGPAVKNGQQNRRMKPIDVPTIPAETRQSAPHLSCAQFPAITTPIEAMTATSGSKSGKPHWPRSGRFQSANRKNAAKKYTAAL